MVPAQGVVRGGNTCAVVPTVPLTSFPITNLVFFGQVPVSAVPLSELLHSLLPKTKSNTQVFQSKVLSFLDLSLTSLAGVKVDCVASYHLVVKLILPGLDPC